MFNKNEGAIFLMFSRFLLAFNLQHVCCPPAQFMAESRWLVRPQEGICLSLGLWASTQQEQFRLHHIANRDAHDLVDCRDDVHGVKNDRTDQVYAISAR